MLIASMDQLSYYSVPKDEGFLDLDPNAGTGGYPLTQSSSLPLGDDTGVYANEENSPKNGTKSSLYKTELCKRFSEFGSCRYGAKCQFAHGMAELRHVVRHPKYKTTKCKSYWGSGHCPYGSRCRFIHEETEALGSQPPQPVQFSPPPTSVFMHDKAATYAGMNGTPTGPSSLQANTGYLYSDMDTSTSALYAKEYAPLPAFEKSASAPWGLGAPSRSQARMTGYGHESYRVPVSASTAASLGAGNGGLTPPMHRAVSTDDSASFPDLQDAIDALVKFSISPSSKPASKPRPSSLESISTTPMETLSASTSTTTTTSGGSSAQTSSSEFSLDSDDMWKHFPTLSDPSVPEFENDWPTGVSLSLEATGLFDAEDPKDTTTSASSTGLGLTPNAKKDETSPRLSVFERFH